MKEVIQMQEDLSLLNQLVESLEESSIKLEEYFKRGELENFNKTKGFMIRIQNKISEVTNAL